MTADTPDAVHALIITFAPDPQVLAENLARIVAQVARVHIIDNSTTHAMQDAVRALQSERVEVLTLGRNTGIAAALNQGIARAQAAGAVRLVLLDQDSCAAPDMVARLTEGFNAAEARGLRCAAIGPTQVDARTGAAAPFVRFGFPFNHKHWPAAGACVPCDFLITSGTLLSLEAHHVIGPFDADLFIDNVDMEWSHRARAAGYALLGSADAQMTHRLGDRLTRRPGGYAAVHAPSRLYYMMRNRVNLYFRPATPKRWIAQDIPRLWLKFAGFSLFVAPRSKNARAMLGGIFDGLRGRLGPQPDSGRGEGNG